MVTLESAPWRSSGVHEHFLDVCNVGCLPSLLFTLIFLRQSLSLNGSSYISPRDSPSAASPVLVLQAVSHGNAQFYMNSGTLVQPTFCQLTHLLIPECAFKRLPLVTPLLGLLLLSSFLDCTNCLAYILWFLEWP